MPLACSPLAGLCLSVMIGSLGLVGCKKKEGDAAVPPPVAIMDAAVAPVTPTEPSAQATPEAVPVYDAPDEYKAIAELVIAELAKRDFQSFVDAAMVSKEQYKAGLEKAWKACPSLAPTEEQRLEVQQMFADYGPWGTTAEPGFQSCAAKHDFAHATYRGAKSREHTLMCGEYMAGDVEISLTIGNEEVVIVLDRLVETDDGWRLIDMGPGLSCADE